MKDTQTVVIESRFCGPPDSANGGYICGVLAERLGADAAQVTLWRPPPLDRPMRLAMDGQAGRLMLDGDEQPVADIQAAEPELTPPASPGFDTAREASERYTGFKRHPFPGCFVCGPERASEDGLRIFAGPVEAREMVAAAWTPHAGLADSTGRVRRRFLWAALDCPGAFAALAFSNARWPLLLGRFCVSVNRHPEPGEPAVVAAWLLHSDGRKHVCGSALYNRAGDLLARARAVWIQPREAAG